MIYAIIFYLLLVIPAHRQLLKRWGRPPEVYSWVMRVGFVMLSPVMLIEEWMRVRYK